MLSPKGCEKSSFFNHMHNFSLTVERRDADVADR